MNLGTIICVDDEEVILLLLRSQLTRAFGDAFTFEATQNGIDALRKLRQIPNEVRRIILLSDWKMPQMDGEEFLQQATKIRPNCIKILLTGQAEARVLERITKDCDLHRCIKKPWDLEEIVEAIQSIFPSSTFR